MIALGIAIAAGIVFLLVSVFWDRVMIPFQARRRVATLLKSKANFDPRSLEKPEYGSVSGDTNRLRITNREGDSWELPWAEVEEVHAFKRDLLATDKICLAFKRSGREEYYEIHEEKEGYHDLLKILPCRLLGFDLEWFCAVAFPAFKTNHQIVWKKSQNQAPQVTGAVPGD
jgi:hypothetical protein